MEEIEMTREEAIKLVKRIKGAIVYTEEEKEALETLIPELKESEDERIRKALVWHLKADVDFVSNGVTKAECLAYLEKQKEQKPNIEICPHSIKSKSYLEQKPVDTSDFKTKLAEYLQNNSPKDGKYVISSESILEMAKEELIKRGELQKPVEWSEEEKEKLNRIYSIIGWAMDEHAFSSCKKLIGDKEGVELQDFLRSIAKPQVQEWSDEDEKYLDYIIKYITNYDFNQDEMGTLEEYHKLHNGAISWLKSLRPQAKQEWNTYDKAAVTCIACCLDGQFVTEAARKQALEWFNKHRRDFLNSPSWKPSEEQMEALDIIVKYGDKESSHIKCLRELYEQLKKL